MRSLTSRHNVYLIGLVTLIYSALLVMTSGCAYRPQSYPHHHSGQGSSGQNLFCAWACQATADAAGVREPSPVVTELEIGPADLPSDELDLLQQPSSVPTRAPPSSPFVRLAYAIADMFIRHVPFV